MLKQKIAGVILGAAASCAAFAAETSVESNVAKDFADFKPDVQFAMCRYAMQAEAAGYLRLIALQDLFTVAAQKTHVTSAQSAFTKLALSTSRSWHIGEDTKAAAEAFAKILDEEDALSEHCNTWLDEQASQKTFNNSELENAKASAMEVVDKYLEKLKAQKSKSPKVT